MEEIQTCCAEPRAQGLVPNTVIQTPRALGRALSQAVAWEYIACNPAQGVKLPRREQLEMQTLSLNEVGRLFDINAGLRVCETCGLHWRDVETVRLDLDLIHVRWAVNRRMGGGPELTEPKTEKSKRSVKTGPETLRTLNEHRQLQRLERMHHAVIWNDTDLVFPT